MPTLKYRDSQGVYHPLIGAGSQQVLSYTHTQTVLSQDWTVTHNLGWNPSVNVTDAGGNLMFGSVKYLPGAMSLTIHFAVAITGTVYCS